MLAFMAFQSEPDNDMLEKLAQASGWTIPESRMQEIAGIYKPIWEDTRTLRQIDLGNAVPVMVFEAE